MRDPQSGICRRQALSVVAGGITAPFVPVSESEQTQQDGAVWAQDFEDLSVGEYPDGWTKVGNDSQAVVSEPTAMGDRALELSGSPGECWEAIADADAPAPTDKPLILTGQVRPTTDGNEGCHNHRAKLLYGTQTGAWNAGDRTKLLELRVDGSTLGRGNVDLGDYRVDAWNKFQIRRLPDGDQVTYTYKLNGTERGETTVEPASSAEDWRYLRLVSGDFTMQWDALRIVQSQTFETQSGSSDDENGDDDDSDTMIVFEHFGDEGTVPLALLGGGLLGGGGIGAYWRYRNDDEG